MIKNIDIEKINKIKEIVDKLAANIEDYQNEYDSYFSDEERLKSLQDKVEFELFRFEKYREDIYRE